MNTDLALYQKFADEARAKPGFGASFFDFDYKTGEWKTGKDKVISNGRQLGADMADLMVGWTKFDETSKRSDYHVVRVADGQPPKKRDELGDLNKAHWKDGTKDPWKFVRILPLFDDETHEILHLCRQQLQRLRCCRGAHASMARQLQISSGRRRQGSADRIIEHRRLREQKKNEQNFDPLFEILGYIERPDSVRHLRPPAAAPAPTTTANKKDNGGGPDKITSGRPDIDDEIPF
jgi:hypothetical protein